MVEKAEKIAYCENCGNALTANGVCVSCETHVSKRSDEAMLTRIINTGGASVNDMLRMPSGSATAVTGKTVHLVVNGNDVNVPLGSEISIGRSSPRNPEQIPDVDLRDYDAENSGVSRLHASLIRRDDLVFISDLNSTNGTRLNNRRLIAGSERLVRDNDTLQLGSLRITIRFDK